MRKLTKQELQRGMGFHVQHDHKAPSLAPLMKLWEAAQWAVVLGFIAWAIWALLWVACGPWACPGTGTWR